MSTFSGIIKEIPSVSVDRFDGINLESKVFFLSHCHTDHMVGLNNELDLPGPLYASEISSVILQRTFKNLKQIRPLHAGIPIELEYLHESVAYKIVVTLIPAGHCPGSVMFLFEYKDQRILYTGDFRMSISSLKKVKNFKINSSEVLKFDTIYIDSTFLRKVYHQFPTQFESVQTVCDIITNWVGQSTKNLVIIKLPARYGLEYLCIEVAKRLKTKIHVNPGEYEVYNCVSEMDEYFTTNTYETRIHACSPVMEKNVYALDCRQIYTKSEHILIIRPTALYWTEWNKTKNTITNMNHNVVRVCYSSHASFTEIEDMLLYLRPSRVELNVSPECRTERHAMKTEVEKILSKFQNVTVTASNQLNNDLFIASNFDHLRSNADVRLRKKSECDRDENSDSEKDEVLNIPIKRIKT